MFSILKKKVCKKQNRDFCFVSFILKPSDKKNVDRHEWTNKLISEIVNLSVFDLFFISVKKISNIEIQPEVDLKN